MIAKSPDWLEDLFARSVAGPDDPTPAKECAEKGHKYQVHGKISPTKLACSRCDTSWSLVRRWRQF